MSVYNYFRKVAIPKKTFLLPSNKDISSVSETLQQSDFSFDETQPSCSSESSVIHVPMNMFNEGCHHFD